MRTRTLFILLAALFIIAQESSAQDSRIEKGLQLYEESKEAGIRLDKTLQEKLLHEALPLLAGSSREELPQAMLQLASIKAGKGEADSTTFYLNQARHLAQQLSLPDTELEILKTAYMIARNAEQWPECQHLSLSIDSIARSCNNPTARVSTMMFKAKNAEDNARLALADKFYQQALKLTDDIEDEATREGNQSSIYYNLYMLCWKQKRYEEALKYYQQSNDLLLKYTGQPNADQRTYLYFEYLEITQAMNDRKASMEYVDTLLSLIPDIQSGQARRVAVGGALEALRKFGEHERIVSLLGLERHDTDANPSIPDLNSTECLYAMESLTQLGRKEEVGKLAARLKEQIDSLYSKPSRKYASQLYQVAYYEYQAGDIDKASQDAVEASDMLISLFRSQMRLLSSDMRKAYWNDFSNTLFEMPTFAMKAGHTHDEFTSAAYEALLFSKGLLLASEKSIAQIIADEGTADDKLLYEELTHNKDQLLALQASDSPDMDEMEAVYQKIIDTDSRLAEQCAAYDAIDDFANIHLDEVRKALGTDDVLIDITDLHLKEEGHHYAAFIITRDSQHPLLLPLCTGEAIDSVESGANHIPNLLYQGRHAQALAQVTTSALLPYLNERGTIYLVPSGAYHQLAVEALPTPDGQLLGDRYHIVRLSSARELCNTPPPSDAPMSAVLYGGLNYDVDANEMAMESARHTLSTMLATRDGDLSSHDSFTPLPLTREEIHAIAHTLDGKATVMMNEGNQGSEESFLALSGHSPSIIHLATHGFFYTPDAAQSIAALSGYEDAMDLTGLVMSGGNAGVKGSELPAGTLCGLLTATDISHLDLRGTRLTCLSACHTGKGETTPEGVYGLQRALKKAGARSILMCLWEASEQSTMLFMKEFYKAYANNGWNTREAFKLARTAVREAYSSPFYWAGFILLD